RLSLLAVELEQLAGAPCHTGADHAGTRLASMAQDVKSISSEVHKLAYRLHPAKLDQLGLAFAAKSLLADFTRHTGILIHASLDDVPSRLDPEAALCLYRVLQESLQNVARHSGAREASVELRRERDWLFLAIEDAGRGFGLERARQ